MKTEIFGRKLFLIPDQLLPSTAVTNRPKKVAWLSNTIDIWNMVMRYTRVHVNGETGI
jgi:hypothetical protein